MQNKRSDVSDDKLYYFLNRMANLPLWKGKFWKFQHRSQVVGGATLLILLIGIFVMQGCKVKEVPVEYKTEYRYIDSVRLKDSVVIIPTERIVDLVPWYDTLHLESAVAWSDAWIDTSCHIIKGQLVNKQGKLVEIRYVDRWKVRDSIVERDKPIYIKGDTVTVTKRPWWAWVTLTWAVVCLCYGAWKIYKKFWL